MATYENTRLLVDGARGSDLGASRAIYRLTAYVSDLKFAFGEWNDTRKSRKQLFRLSDRMLEDIGLNRGDISEMKFGRSQR